MNLHHKSETARAKTRKHGITVSEVARMNTGDHWHGAYVAQTPDDTALRPIKANKRLVRLAIKAVATRHPCLQQEHELPTPEEYLVGHLWCVRVSGTADNFEELVTKYLRATLTGRRTVAVAH